MPSFADGLRHTNAFRFPEPKLSPLRKRIEYIDAFEYIFRVHFMRQFNNATHYNYQL